MTKTTKRLTEAQTRILSDLSDEHYEFPPPKLVRVYEALLWRGYVEAKLALASRDFVRGEVNFREAFRRTKAGVEALADLQQPKK